MKLFERVISSENELGGIVHELLMLRTSRDVWTFSGNMGAGKTTLVGYIVKKLGNVEANSPTYAIHQQYVGQGTTIDHLDLYRITSFEEFEGTGLSDLFLKSSGLILIEWPERVNLSSFYLGWNVLEVRIDFTQGPNEERRISVFQKKS